MKELQDKVVPQGWDTKELSQGNIVMKIMMSIRRKILFFENACVENDKYIPVNKMNGLK
jgi:hypothetical protein